MRYVYLHGFASGPQSRKAQAFRQALGVDEISLEIPELDQGDFEHITISGQLRVVEECLAGAACRLIGSSMGGYLAALYAAEHPEEVDRLVLLAPAFEMASRWEIPGWEEAGWLEVFHYGAKEQRPVHYGLLEDARRFPGFPNFRQRALIFHGVHDSVVPIGFSREFVASHPNAKLREMESDHELLDVLDAVTREATTFLSVGRVAESGREIG